MEGTHFVTGLILFSVLLIQSFESVVNYPRLTVTVKKSGFHREIDYSIHLPTEIDCDVILVQTLHQGLYISNDQLNDMKKLNLIQSYVSSYINIELPMEKSSPFTIYLFGKAKSNIHFKLPIHLRYQAPATKRFKHIPLVEPEMYLSCASEFYLRKTNDTFKLPCPNSSSIHNVYELPNAESCEWFDVDSVTNFDSPTTISVPVGNESLGIPVFIVTLLVAWGAATYLIFAILKHKQQRICKKIS